MVGRDEATDQEPIPAYVLAADVGNTHVTVGAVQGEQTFAVVSVAVDDSAGLTGVLEQMWSAMTTPRRVVACSVNPEALGRFEAAVSEVLDEDVVVVGRDIPLPIETSLASPERIGVDRLCCAAAAYERLQQACVVVDLGTAITVDCVNPEGVFIGGAILPGLRMQARALHEGTAQLPLVEMAEPDGVFGDDTAGAIRHGVVTGVRGAVRGLVEAYATEINQWPVVVTTGGDAGLFGNPEGIVQAQAPPLCLMGVARAFYKSLPEFPQ